MQILVSCVCPSIGNTIRTAGQRHNCLEHSDGVTERTGNRWSLLRKLRLRRAADTGGLERQEGECDNTGQTSERPQRRRDTDELRVEERVFAYGAASSQRLMPI